MFVLRDDGCTGWFLGGDEGGWLIFWGCAALRSEAYNPTMRVMCRMLAESRTYL